MFDDFAEFGKIVDVDVATSIHYNVGKEVRTAIEKIGGTILGDLPKPRKAYRRLRENKWRDSRRKRKRER